jgi:hypothetical protein
MAASVFHSGSFGTAALGSNEISVVGCGRFSRRRNWSNSKTARAEGYVLREATFKDCSVTIDADFDFGNNPFQTPYSIAAGHDAHERESCVCIKASSGACSTGLAWTFSSLVVDSTPQKLQVDGRITTKISAKGNGSYTAP